MNAANETLESIHELNLSYLLLAQRLLRADFEIGMYRLGLSKEVSDLISRLSLAQVIKIAASPSLLCFFRIGDAQLLEALTLKAKNAELTSTHAAIVLAGQPLEALA